MPLQVVDIFLECYEAIRRGELIKRQSARDKEFHFQDWFEARLEALGLNYEAAGRNKYPDFSLVHSPEGYEMKGLKFPGRIASYDSNSQVPTGQHNGREIFYVFGRYPANPLREDEYPVHDLLICHDDFLNADHHYVHENKSIRGFGSYGDIMIRDRKMYVAPTPFTLTTGTEGQITLILPQGYAQDVRLIQRGELTRVEANQLIIGYQFDLRTNKILPQMTHNPNAGTKHNFSAHRPKTEPGPVVTLVNS